MAPTQDDIQTRLEDLLDKPKTLSSDGMSVTEQTIDDIIKLSKHLARKSAVDSSQMGLRMGVLRPPEH